MTERVCISEMRGECSGGGCKDPKTGVIKKDLMYACNWREKMEATLAVLPSVESADRIISCSVANISQNQG
ncbi:hypothetical protein HYU95_01245 [Candidatus Daviesbacteria bacterium]|nr:hypothetical protein [Candidatus Daviesbacteria bacterium]